MEMEKKNSNNQCDLLSDSDESFLQPISHFYPPNQIINKNYAPDEKPVLKLIKPEKPQILTCQVLRNSYATMFDEEDTLGYHYSYSLTHNIVYLKMNNKSYMKHKTKNGSYRYLAGMFLPPEKLLSQDFKSHKNIFKGLSDIEFTEYKQKVSESFGANCKSNGLDLRFSSNFESGNLFIAMKKKNYEYELILQNDINSKGNTQWFNFVVDFRTQGNYKFRILNFTKSYSQYENGMKVISFTFPENQNMPAKWSRVGQKIQYDESSICREDSSNKNYYSLKFQYRCQSPRKVLFCYFYPYTTLDLEKFLKKIIYRKISIHMKMEKIKVCEALSGLPIYALHIFHKKNPRQESITNFSPLSPSRRNSNKTNKSIVILGRQHSGETQSSFFIEGVIDMLMENGQMDYLKKSFDFYIFPMINADGVFYGNYRTNLSGTDLNRIWRNPRRDIHPQVYYTKKYLMNVNCISPISLILDVHGHSKSLNSFFYGNPPKKDYITGTYEDTKLFPFVCSKKIKQVSFSQSTFTISEEKKNSARVVLSQYFPRALVYTLENSFQGWKKDNGTIHEYTPQSLRKIGRELILAYLEYEKLIEKNPTIKQKWEKQIQQFKSRQNQLNSIKQDLGESDSEAGKELIDVDEQFPGLRQQEPQIFFKSAKCSEFTSILKNKTNLNHEKKGRTLNVLSQKKYTKYTRNIPILESPAGKLNFRKSKQQSISPTNSQGFLSIVKIKTSNRIENMGEDKTKERQSDQQSNTFHQRSSDKNVGYNFQKQNILDKLRRKNIKIEEAVNSCSGMKTFLQAMGIPLDRKYNS